MQTVALRIVLIACLAFGVTTTAEAQCEIRGGDGFRAPPGGGVVDVRFQTLGNCATFFPDPVATRLSTEAFGTIAPAWASIVDPLKRDPADSNLWHWQIRVEPNTTGELRRGYTNVRFVSNTPPGQTGGTWNSFFQEPLSPTNLEAFSVSTNKTRFGAGGTFVVTDRVNNNSNGTPAGAFTIQYYLRNGPVSIALRGERTIATLAAGSSSTGSTSVVVPDDAPAGPYFLRACANDERTVSESTYTDNCTPFTVTVTVVQLTVAVSESSESRPDARDLGGRRWRREADPRTGRESAGGNSVSGRCFYPAVASFRPRDRGAAGADAAHQ